MESVEKWLKKHKIQYTVDADGKIDISGYLDLSSVTSIPDGFNPTVGGYLDLSSVTSIPDGFNPTVGGSLYLSSVTSGRKKQKKLPEGFLSRLKKSIELRFNDKGFTFADNILAKIIHARGSVKKVLVHGKTKASWLVSDDKGEHHAHGATLEAAMADLMFKTSDRDVSKYRNMPKDTVKSPYEWATVYRIITGACQEGTQYFMDSKGKLKKSYTLAEILEQTRGAFGHDRFVDVVGA